MSATSSPYGKHRDSAASSPSSPFWLSASGAVLLLGHTRYSGAVPRSIYTRNIRVILRCSHTRHSGAEPRNSRTRHASLVPCRLCFIDTSKVVNSVTRLRLDNYGYNGSTTPSHKDKLLSYESTNFYFHAFQPHIILGGCASLTTRVIDTHHVARYTTALTRYDPSS